MVFLFWVRCLVKFDKVVLLSIDEVRFEVSRGFWVACCIVDDFFVVEIISFVYGCE